MRKRKGEWCFSRAPDGSKHDAWIHEEIMEGVDDLPLRARSARAVVKLGVDLSVVLLVYGLRPEDLEVS